MNNEEPVTFESGEHRLHGVLHRSDKSSDGAPAVIFMSGWSGCRLGPHRMFVKTARRLSAEGYHCLRFDFAGRGDSDGETADTTIASMSDDVGSAMDFLEQRLGSKNVVLLGICSGGKVAISRASQDERVKKLVLWSAEPMGQLAERKRRTRKTLFILGQYLIKLFRPRTLRRILAGEVNTDMVKKAVANCERATPAERKAEAVILKEFSSYKGKVLLIYGTNDPETCMASNGYETLCRDAGMAYDSHRIEGANHSFYSLEWEKQVIDLTADWLT